MSTASETTIKHKPRIDRILSVILKELHSIRQEINLVLPQEDIKDYSRPSRIKRSYQKALKQYPPEF